MNFSITFHFDLGEIEKITFAGDIIDIQDLIISTAAGPAVRDNKAQTATSAIVNSTRIGTYTKNTN